MGIHYRCVTVTEHKLCSVTHGGAGGDGGEQPAAVCTPNRAQLPDAFDNNLMFIMRQEGAHLLTPMPRAYTRLRTSPYTKSHISQLASIMLQCLTLGSALQCPHIRTLTPVSSQSLCPHIGTHNSPLRASSPYLLLRLCAQLGTLLVPLHPYTGASSPSLHWAHCPLNLLAQGALHLTPSQA